MEVVPSQDIQVHNNSSQHKLNMTQQHINAALFNANTPQQAPYAVRPIEMRHPKTPPNAFENMAFTCMNQQQKSVRQITFVLIFLNILNFPLSHSAPRKAHGRKAGRIGRPAAEKRIPIRFSASTE
jgi:hypothetical protein